MDTLQINLTSLQLQHPFRMLITGPSGIGKSRFVLDQILSRRDSINEKIKRIIYYYGTFDSAFHIELNSMVKSVFGIEIVFEKGISNVDPESLDVLTPTLLIFDDLFMEVQQYSEFRCTLSHIRSTGCTIFSICATVLPIMLQ